MAVTAPTPPTPPTPPSVPAVTLGGGGSVTESTTPVSGYQSDADRQVAQARQAVARGDGPLAKTTQEQPAAKQGQQSGSQQDSAKNNGKEGQTVVQTDQQTAAASQAGGEQTQQQTAASPSSAASSARGPVFWGVFLVLVFVVAYALFRVMMKRKQGKSRLSFQDINETEGEGAGSEVSSGVNLRGLTPDEALQQLEEAEAEELRQARLEAQERLRAAGRLQPPPDPPKAAVPKQAARQYRDQLTTMLPEQPKKVVRKPVPKKDEEGHFEVRV